MMRMLSALAWCAVDVVRASLEVARIIRPQQDDTPTRAAHEPYRPQERP